MGVIGIFIAILVFCVVIVVHELGHFWAARKAGILVEEFSVGFGPRLFSFKPGETRYSLKLLPLGGSCRMLWEDDDEADDEKSEEEKARLRERSFPHKSVKARMFVIMAGVVMNLLLTLFLSLLFTFNTNFQVPEVRGFDVRIALVAEGSAAQAAGLLEGDRILTVGGVPVNTHNDFTLQTGVPVNVEVARVVEYEGGHRAVGLEFELSDGSGITLNELSPAQAAGLLPGDRITAVNGTRIRTNNDFRLYMGFMADGSPIVFDVLRDGQRHQVSIQPYFVEGAQIFRIGFLTDMRTAFFGQADPSGTFRRASFAESVETGFFNTVYYVRSTLTALSRLVTNRLNMEHVGGPIMIVTAIGDTTQASFTAGGFSAAVWNNVFIAAFISANLFVFNLLPIPALDGGKMVFLTIEAIRRKPISPEREGLASLVGFALLMIFAVFVAYNDIMRIL